MKNNNNKSNTRKLSIKTTVTRLNKTAAMPMRMAEQYIQYKQH